MPIMLGMAVAFMAKMGVAVLVGEAVSKLPRPLVRRLRPLVSSASPWRCGENLIGRMKSKQTPGVKSGGGFVRGNFLVRMGRRRSGYRGHARGKVPPAIRGVAGCRERDVTKGALAAFLGAGIRRWIRDRVAPEVVRYLAVILLLVLGVLSVLESCLRRAEATSGREKKPTSFSHPTIRGLLKCNSKCDHEFTRSGTNRCLGSCYFVCVRGSLFRRQQSWHRGQIDSVAI